jgi:hypothetical protein
MGPIQVEQTHLASAWRGPRWRFLFKKGLKGKRKSTGRRDEIWALRIGHRREIYADRAFREPAADNSVSEP